MSTRRIRPLVAALALGMVVAVAQPAAATFPFPAGTANPYDYTQLHINDGNCPPDANSDLPKGFSCTGDFKLTNAPPVPGDADYDPTVENNPQELWGVRGPGTNKAWEVTTGRPDTIISVLDSGIEWNTPELANKVHLNMGELPVPCTASPCASAFGSPLQQYDVNGDGVFNVRDYANDPRVTDANGNGILDPEDLIKTFSDGVDQDGNGYTDDIAGWDFYENDNDPADDVHYDHGTGEARDSSAEIELHTTQCPNCMVEPLRVGDSFIADINDFAQAAIYATDNGVSVIQEALGTLNHTGFAQTAVDYAYSHGVLVVASEADEEAGHHNYPAALNHTMVVNSVTHAADVPGTPLPAQAPESYLTFNGCTNFGGYTWVSVESASCSSDATGQGSGMAGLLYSAARNAVDEGVIQPASDGAGRPLSAEEAKQLVRVASDDIDFSTPRCDTNPATGAPGCGPANNFATGLAGSQRFVTTAGWDQITGWGRDNVQRAVNLVMAGKIPPEADVTSPGWWAPLGTTGSAPIVGRVAAPRASSYTYTYEVQFAPGVQPPPWPGRDQWTNVFTSKALTSPVQGTLATIDLAKVRAAIDACSSPPPAAPGGCSGPYGAPPFTDPTSQDHPEKDAFRVRVVVCANGACPQDGPGLERDPSVAIEQRQFFSSPHPDAVQGFPRFLNADGSGSPVFAPLQGGQNALVLGDGNGYVHAFLLNGKELAGFPVHTDPIPLPATGHNAYTNGAVPNTVYSPIMLGTPAIAPLLGPKRGLDVAVTALDGRLYAWDSHGHPLPGFPVHTNPAYSTPAARTSTYTPFQGFTAMPAAADLDPSYPGLELVAGAEDTHVYAFHADGTPVPGWPVFLGDPSKITGMDPVTDTPTYSGSSGVDRGGKIIAGVSLGDVFGDGRLEVAANVNEEYTEPPNWSGARAPTADALGTALGGNTRTYLLWPDGANHPPTASTQATANPYDQSYVPGWPVKIGLVVTELLPDVGEGSDGAPVMADVNGDGKLEIGTASYAGAPYLLNGDGTSFYGSVPEPSSSGVDQKDVTMASEAAESHGTATDFPSLASLGGGVFGRLGGDGSPLSFAMGAAGLKRLLDVSLPDQQLGAEDQVAAWDATTGTYDPGFPALMNDLQFFTTPAIADLNGVGQPEVIEGSAMYDLRAYSLGGQEPSGWPKFTGGWMVTTPAVGPFGKNASTLDLAAVTREGYLWVWSTGGSACQSAQWPKYQHDLWNTGNYDSSAPTGLGCAGA